MSKPYSSLPNRTAAAANGIGYAYRDTEDQEDSTPLVLPPARTEREAAWQTLTAAIPRFASYPDKTDREIPVIRLTPRSS